MCFVATPTFVNLEGTMKHMMVKQANYNKISSENLNHKVVLNHILSVEVWLYQGFLY